MASYFDERGVDNLAELTKSLGRKGVKTATIASGQSLSNVVDLEGYLYLAFKMPAAWDTANLTFAALDVRDGVFDPVYDDAGVEVSVTAAAARVIAVDINALKLAPLRFIKIRSGTAASPVNQTAARDIIVILKN